MPARHVDLLRAALEDLETEGLIETFSVDASKPGFRCREWGFTYRVSGQPHDQQYGSALRRLDTGEILLRSGDYTFGRWRGGLHTVWMPGVVAALRASIALITPVPQQAEEDPDEMLDPDLDGHEFDRWAEEDPDLLPEPRSALDRLLAEHPLDQPNEGDPTP